MIVHITEFEIMSSLAQYFSTKACRALLEYYEELEDCTLGPVHFDAVAINCEWMEDDLDEVLGYYSNTIDSSKAITYDDKIELLSDYTTVLELGKNQVLYIQF